MDQSLHPDHIVREEFDKILGRYSSTVPAKLKELDKKRLHEIPAALNQRKKAGDSYLEREEVLTLVDWKLSHGTYRPKLRSLVESNPDLTTATRTAFTFTSNSATKVDTTTIPTTVILSQLQPLTALKGIGPATASLLLNTLEPDRIPFFSDELCRWLLYEDKAGCRWDRKLKYDVKEYGALLERFAALRTRLGVGAVEAECVAWVLGREAKSGGGSGGKGASGEMGRGLKKDVATKAGVKSTAGNQAEATSPAKLKQKRAKGRTADSKVSEVEDGGGTERRRSKRLKTAE